MLGVFVRRKKMLQRPRLFHGSDCSHRLSKRSGGAGKRRRFGGGAREKTSACAVSALLRTRIDQGVPQGRFLDPTTRVGLQAPTALLAPSGYSIGSSKGSPFHEHRRGL